MRVAGLAVLTALRLQQYRLKAKMDRTHRAYLANVLRFRRLERSSSSLNMNLTLCL